MLAPPPNAEEIRAWFAFFTTLMQLLSPLMLAALTALTVFFGKKSAEKTGIAKLQQLGQKTHDLVNGKHTAALQLIVEQSTRLANLTKDPIDIAALETAKQNLAANQK